MKFPRRLVVEDVRGAAAWYARVFDGVIEAVDDATARLALGEERIALVLEHGVPPPDRKTPVLELGVDDLPAWLEAALAAGATRATPETLTGYAQFHDPHGYLWALRQRVPPPP
jgi:uncharacterized glyoxalase superfamily protein PhnB